MTLPKRPSPVLYDDLFRTPGGGKLGKALTDETACGKTNNAGRGGVYKDQLEGSE